MQPVRSGIFLVLLITVCFMYTPKSSLGQTGPDSTGPALQPGVSAALAAYRSSVLQHIVYNLQFNLPQERTAPVLTTEDLHFDLSDNRATLQIDFKNKGSGLDSLTVNGKKIPVEYTAEHILIRPRYLLRGSNQIGLHFSSITQPLNRNTDYCYTLLVPDRARTLFPCFDQPDCKAVFNLTLSLPAGWKAVANAPLKDSSMEEGRQIFHFLPSSAISTYLFAFAAGRFSEEDAKEDGRPMHFYFRETDSTKLRLSLAPVFRIQADALAFMQQYTGIAYPFSKFDFVAIPDFQFGGMEHPGAIQYKAGSLFLDEGATRDQFLGRSNLLSHETAHMWFGDLVTMRWFNDVWMKEVFANFMADKISNITLPDDKADLKFLSAHFPAAYSIDRTRGSHPIRQPLDNLQEAGSLYGNIIYHKAPIMMRQLERLMGAAAFRDGLRDYLKQYAGGNASWPDLIRNLGDHSTADLQAWNRVWVNEPGRPRFDYRLRTDKGRIRDLMITQKGEDGSARIWPQLFSIALVYKDHSEELTVNMNAPHVSLSVAAGRPAPLYMIFNADGQGYGLFPVDRPSLTGIADNKSPLTRAAVYINCYENMLDGLAVSPRQLLALDRAALAKESEELVLNLLVDQLVSIYWRFIPATTRDSMARRLEEEIWQAMLGDRPANIKKILFRTYSNIVLTRDGTERLYTVWKREQPPAGVKLTEEDYTNLAAALAIRSDSLRSGTGQGAILQEQGRRIKNQDRKERWEYLLPSLSADVRERDAYFATLQTAEGRKKEAWVLTALSYLHHPLRTAISEKYLPRTLEWLEDIQRTGDVFFPQSWLQVSLAWYRSPSAAALVRNFLRARPDYNPRLRAKILQAADNTERRKLRSENK